MRKFLAVPLALIICLTLGLGSLGLVAHVSALDYPPDDGLPGSPMPTKVNNLKEKQTTAQAQAEQLKQEARKKVCENRKNAVQNIMGRVKDRGDKRLTVITKVADNIKAFKVKKGLSINNYDSLVANVNTKKTAAQAAIDAVQVSKDSFNCNTDKPGSLVATFKEKVKAQNDALKAYKDAVKDLLLAVKTANKAAERV